MANDLYSYAQWQYSAYCDFVISNGKIFFINLRNLPVSLDIQQGTAEIVSGIKEYYNVLLLDSIEKMVQANGKVYCFESKSENMVIYDLESKCCQYKELNYHQKAWGNALLITLHEDDIYIFPKYMDFVLKIDTKTDRMTRMDDPIYAKMNKNASVGIYDEYVYFFQRNSDTATEYDLCTGCWKEYHLSHKLGNLVCARYFDGFFFLLSRDGELMAWNVESHVLETLIFPFTRAENPPYFSMCTVTKKNIWLLPDIGENIYIYCRESKKLEVYDKYPKGFDYLKTEEWGKYLIAHEYGDIFYHDMHSANYLLCIDKNSGEERWIKPTIPGRIQECQYYIENRLQVILKETEFPIEKFIECVGKNVTERMSSTVKENLIWNSIGSGQEGWGIKHA